MRTVFLILILLFSSSAFAISLEDGLRIRLNDSIKNNSKKTSHEVTSEFIHLYLETLKYKELSKLSSHIAKQNKNDLTEAKIKAQIDPSKNSALKNIYKVYYISNNIKMMDIINFNRSKERLQDLLHVKVESVKLPLIPKTPDTKTEAILIALKSQGLNQRRDKNSLFEERIKTTIKDVNHQWQNYKQTQEKLKETADEKEKINNNYKYRVASYGILATNASFLSTILTDNYSFKNENNDNIMEMFFNNKAKQQSSKKQKTTSNCFKVNTDALNVRQRPSSKSKVIHLYKRGEIICALKQSFSWISTKHGWCSKDYLIKANKK